MAKATTIKEALNKFEESEQCKACDSKKVIMYGQIPPIEKMDASLSTLQQCEHLSLSTNVIEKIANLNGLKNLKILSLARNNIKSLTGLEAVGDTLEELWISYNNIEKLKGINVLKKLKVLYIRNNSIKDNAEFMKLADLPCMIELNFVGNPLYDVLNENGPDYYNDTIMKKLPKLKRLDGYTIIREDDEDEQQAQ